MTVPLWSMQAADAATPDTSRYQLQPVDADMSAYDYQRTYRKNQQRVRKYITHHSEDMLLDMGMSKSSIRMVGALAGAAITQEATVYLNASRWLALDIKDAGQDDRAVIFAIKRSW
jgi:hypothetical protein